MSVLMMIGCAEEEYQLGEILAPSNIEITLDVEGQDDANPNGDGTGIVHLTATADNAIAYRVYANGQEFLVPGGKQTITFSATGLRTYEILVAAIGTGGMISTAAINAEILVLYAPPAELLDKLHGGSSKTWRIKSAVPNHFGLGPPDGTNGPEWYGAGPNDKAGTGMYDDRYVIGADGSFQHQTGGTVLGRTIYMDQLGGSGGTANGADTENYPLADYTGTYTLTGPGGVETINLSGTGFFGYYSGSHSYSIENRSNPNEISLRTVDGNAEFAWYFILTSEE